MKQGGVVAVALLLSGGLVAVPMERSSGDPCNFAGIDLEGFVKRIVGRLPPHHTQPDSAADEVVSGLFIEPITYKDMNNLQTFGPVVGFCRDGLKLVQFDLVSSNGPLHVVIPWRTCGGKNGTIGIYTKARVTVTFQIVDPSADLTNQTLNESPMITHGIPEPVSVQTLAFSLKGAGEALQAVAPVIGWFFQGIAREFGEEMVTYRLRDVLNEIGRS
ncbi:uncharacterized protein LOC144166347 [Haemaphysalis longicornis]